LVNPSTRLAVEQIARLEAHRNAIAAAGVDHSLHARPPCSACDQDAFQGPLGLERGGHGVDSNQAVHRRDSGIL
jgi:hypothetical protein